MALYAFDGASNFDLDLAKARGGIIATVYIVGTPGGFPHADRARVDAIRAKGLGASPNWERAANFFDTCSLAAAYSAGVEAADACRTLGFPPDGSISCSFSFDFDTSGPRLPEMAQKLKQVQAGLAGQYLPMAYAEQELIDYIVANKVIPGKHWLMMSTFGQPYNPTSPHVCMVQGHDVAGNWIQSLAVPGTDINTVTDPYALNAWWPTGSPYATKGDAPMTPAEIQAIAHEVWNYQLRGDLPGTPPTVTPPHSAGSWLANTNVAVRDDATGVGVHAEVTAAVTALTTLMKSQASNAQLSAAVAELKTAINTIQAGGGPAAIAPFKATITPEATP